MESSPEERVHDVLAARGKTLATAESCTGGLLGDRITEVPGSSAYYLGGVIAYANDVKEDLLGVLKATMIEHGAVSKQTALEMARGARRALKADYGLSVTGIAGPGGGTPEKPVGLTWVAVSGPDGDRAARHVYPGSRVENKHAAVDSVLELLLQIIAGDQGEAIQVEVSRDSKDRLVPIAFTIAGERYGIIDWGRRWKDGEREHMLVRTHNGETVELAFDERRSSWHLLRRLQAPGSPSNLV